MHWFNEGKYDVSRTGVDQKWKREAGNSLYFKFRNLAMEWKFDSGFKMIAKSFPSAFSLRSVKKE